MGICASGCWLLFRARPCKWRTCNKFSVCVFLSYYFASRHRRMSVDGWCFPPFSSFFLLAFFFGVLWWEVFGWWLCFSYNRLKKILGAFCALALACFRFSCCFCFLARSRKFTRKPADTCAFLLTFTRCSQLLLSAFSQLSLGGTLSLCLLCSLCFLGPAPPAPFFSVSLALFLSLPLPQPQPCPVRPLLLAKRCACVPARQPPPFP